MREWEEGEGVRERKEEGTEHQKYFPSETEPFQFPNTQTLTQYKIYTAYSNDNVQ